MTPLDEPLLQSAPMAWHRAADLCRKDTATGESCAWIHGFWQYLRLAGVASTPGLHVSFFSDALLRFTGGKDAPRVLISGAADYSMLALVLGACQSRGIRPDVTVLDQCETPLMLNRSFADRAGVAITTRLRDILEYSETRPYDVICTHSFLSEFPRESWPRLLDRWRRLLRPGGAAVTINRVRADAGPDPIRFSPGQAAALRAAVLEKAPTLPAGVAPEPPALVRAAEIYAEKRRTWPAQSREQLVSLLESAGLRVDSLLVGEVAGSMPSGLSGPTTPAGADYARIVAIRP